MNLATIVALIIRFLPQVAEFVLSLEAKRRSDLDANKIMKKDSVNINKAMELDSDEKASRAINAIFNDG